MCIQVCRGRASAAKSRPKSDACERRRTVLGRRPAVGWSGGQAGGLDLGAEIALEIE